MSKFIVLSREYDRRQKYVEKYIDQKVCNSFIKDARLSLSERQLNYLKKNKSGYQSSIVRLKNYCSATGHARSVYRVVKLSRHKFNTMVLDGLIPGCTSVHGRIFMNTSLSQLVAQIKLNLGRKRLICKVPYSNQNFNILKILYHEGYIRGFRVTEFSTKIFVFLKLAYFKSSLLDIAYFCPKNKHSYLTYKKLIRFYGLKNFGIVSTNIGLLTIQQCFLHKKGGTLVLLVK